MLSEELWKSSLLCAEMEKSGIFTSSAFCHCGSFSFTADCEHENCAPCADALSAALHLRIIKRGRGQ
jgi:hypothetical protein